MLPTETSDVSRENKLKSGDLVVERVLGYGSWEEFYRSCLAFGLWHSCFPTETSVSTQLFFKL